MMRYWVTVRTRRARLAHGALLAAEGAVSPTPHDPVELASASWPSASGAPPAPASAPDIELLGIRRGETLTETLDRPRASGSGRSATRASRRSTAARRRPGGRAPGSAERSRCAPTRAGRRELARAVWLEAMRRPGLLVPAR